MDGAMYTKCVYSQSAPLDWNSCKTRLVCEEQSVILMQPFKPPSVGVWASSAHYIVHIGPRLVDDLEAVVMAR
jgi:hypothetical protein